MAGKDTNTGAKRARELRQALGLDVTAPVSDLLSVVEDVLELPVNVTVMPSGLEGLCWQLGGHTLLWVKAHEFVSRRRFTLAHELGHIRCGHDAASRLETFTTLSGKATTSAEVQANAFAAELLVPAAGVRAELNGREPTLETAVEMAVRFGTSALVAVYRLVTLGLCDATIAKRVEAGEHHAVWRAVDPPPITDGLALTADELPRVSPLLRGGGLAALVTGAITLPELARQTGVDPDVLRSGLALIGG